MELIYSRIEEKMINWKNAQHIKNNVILYDFNERSKLLNDFVNKIKIQKDISDSAAGENLFGLVKYLKHRGLVVKQHGIDLAAGNGHMKMITYLYNDEGVGGLKISHNGLNMILSKGNMKMLKYLESIPSYDIIIFQHDINAAAASGNIEMVKYVEHTYNINVDKDGLSNAIKRGQLEMVKWLIDDDKREFKNVSLIKIGYYMDDAAESGNIEMVKYLYEVYQLPVNQRGINLAVRKGKLEMVKYLQSEAVGGLKVNQIGINWAAGFGHMEMVKYLESENVDLKVNEEGLILAFNYGTLEMVKYLLSALNYDINENMIYDAIAHNKLEIVKYFIQQGYEIDQEDLDEAIKNGYIEMVKMIIKNFPKLILDNSTLSDEMKIIYSLL